MQIIPVLDILDGVVVQAIAGERQQYRRIHSVLTESRDPSVVIRCLQHEIGCDTFYLADLDAIQFGRPNRCVIAELAQCCDQLIVDCGARNAGDVEWLLDSGVSQVVVALETLPSPQFLSDVLSIADAEQIVFSLDLKQGKPLTLLREWQNTSAAEIAQTAIDSGHRNFIVLDLAMVGTGQGLSTLSLCSSVRRLLPQAQVITGGGVSDIEDLRKLQDTDVDAVLIASALHNGSVTGQDIKGLLAKDL